MANTEKLNNFLMSCNYKKIAKEFAKPGTIPFITISREAGAGGRALANELVKQFAMEKDPVFDGWSLVDKELCKAILDNPEMHVSISELLTEEYNSSISDFLSSLLGKTPQDDVYREIFSTVRKLAYAGKAIILGRAGSFMTNDMLGGIHIRLIAPKGIRIARMRSEFKLSQPLARKWVEDQDESREKLVEKTFGMNISSPVHYSAVFNTQLMPIETIAKSIKEMILDQITRD